MKSRTHLFLFTNIKIKNLLIYMLVISFLALIVMNILFSIISSNSMEDQFLAHFSSVNVNIENLVRNNNSYIENVMEQICNTEQMHRYLQSGKDIDTHKYLVESLKSVISMRSDCLETIKIFSSESFTISAAENEPIGMFILAQQYNLSSAQVEKPFFSTLYLSPETQDAYYIYVYPIRSSQLDTFREYLGTAVALINLNKMLDNQDFFKHTQSSSYFVVDDTDTVLYNTGTLDATAFYQTCLNKGNVTSSSVSIVKHMGTDFFYASTSISDVSWRIFTVIAKEDLAVHTRPLHFIAFIFSLLSAIIILVIAFILINNIYRPIQTMTDKMGAVQFGNQNNHIPITSHNELGELSAHINAMIDQLDASANEIISVQQRAYEAELAERKSQIYALQSQINPHFLYNTLECIQGIATEYNAYDIVKITSSMAKIFRYSVASSSSSTLGDELKCVKNYLSIMQIRFNSTVLLDLNVPDYLLSTPILRMTLQPIVENAFTHGLENKNGEGYILISAQQTPNTLIVCVSNNGSPLSSETVAEMNRKFQNNTASSPNANIKGGMALLNINRRLLLADPANGGISVSITDDGMTCFRLVFPL